MGIWSANVLVEVLHFFAGVKEFYYGAPVYILISLLVIRQAIKQCRFIGMTKEQIKNHKEGIAKDEKAMKVFEEQGKKTN